MPGPIHRLLTDDHRRLEALLDRAAADPRRIDAGAYAEFRSGLLRHIGIEEKILLPAAQRRRGGEPLPIAATLRLQHGGLAALLVPTPTARVVTTLRAIHAVHDPLEEDPGALYETCERLAADELPALVERMRAAPAVPVSQHVDGPKVWGALERALARAGFSLAAPDG